MSGLNRLGITFPEACSEKKDLNVSDPPENSREDIWKYIGACSGEVSGPSGPVSELKLWAREGESPLFTVVTNDDVCSADAMATARPVIGYDSDGTAELIDDGHNGLLYDGSTEHLADCMSQCVNAPEWATSLGREGWEKARREFTNEVYARQIHDVLCEVAYQGNGENQPNRTAIHASSDSRGGLKAHNC
jgi:hypothetical protein